MTRTIIVAALLLLSIAVNAETPGTINRTTANTTGIFTGLFAVTLSPYCSLNTSCQQEDACLTDFDGTSSGSSSGWCVPGVETRCRHDNDWYGSGSAALCANTTVKRVCTSGAWSTEFCTGTDACLGGNCTANATTTTTTVAVRYYKTASLSAAEMPPVNVTQGESNATYLLVSNTGEFALFNITPLFPFDWIRASPDRLEKLNTNLSFVFSVNITAPADAAPKIYAMNVSITTNNASLKPTSTFTLTVFPSAQTVETTIAPAYLSSKILLNAIEQNVTVLRTKGANTAEAEQRLAAIRTKLQAMKDALDAQDHFRASQLLDEIRSDTAALQEKVAAIEVPLPPKGGIDLFTLLGIAVGLIAAAVLGYLLWPVPEKPAS